MPETALNLVAYYLQMRRSTGPWTELLGAPSTFGTRCTGPDRDRPVFLWTELWTGPSSLDRA